MSWKFNPPPGWPAQPEGWVPPPGWVPDPSWPAPPAGWQFWMPAGSAPMSTPPAAAPPPAAPPPPASGGPGFAAGPPPPFSSGAPQFGSGPVSSGPTAPFGSPGMPGYAAPVKRARPWFGQWWGILTLIAMLLLGAAAGYGATRAALDASDDSETNSAGELDPTASESPLTGAEPGAESPGPEPPDLPSLPPVDLSAVCTDVAVIMLTMATAPLEAEDQDAFADAVIESRRTAADELREVEGADPDEQAALDGLADEVDAAAQMVEDDPASADAVESSFDRVSEAYDAFNAEHC